MPFGGSVRAYTVARLDADLSPAEAAEFHEGLAHPARVAAMRALRENGGAMPMSELRKRVAEALGSAIDTRTMQFHASKMERAGLVDVYGRRRRQAATAGRGDVGTDEVRLLRDVTLRIRGA